jgi:hypothetical protein
MNGDPELASRARDKRSSPDGALEESVWTNSIDF